MCVCVCVCQGNNSNHAQSARFNNPTDLALLQTMSSLSSPAGGLPQRARCSILTSVANAPRLLPLEPYTTAQQDTHCMRVCPTSPHRPAPCIPEDMLGVGQGGGSGWDGIVSTTSIDGVLTRPGPSTTVADLAGRLRFPRAGLGAIGHRTPLTPSDPGAVNLVTDTCLLFSTWGVVSDADGLRPPLSGPIPRHDFVCKTPTEALSQN